MKDKRRDDDSDDVQAWTEHAIYAPPWRMRMPDGKLGPEYGPASEGELDRLLSEYEQSTAGGGLWDADEDARTRGTMTRKQAARVERSDMPTIAEYLFRRPGGLAPREVECYLRFWVDGLSYLATARKMGIHPGAVRSMVHRIRGKAANM
jgi:hypothetical protein